MTISHHPSDDLLQRYVGGHLSAGPSIVLAAHLEACARCRQWVGDLEILGGLFLSDMPPATMDPGAFARTLSLLDAAATERPARAQPRTRSLGIVLPKALVSCELSAWRWFAPGMHWSRVTLPDAPDANLVLFRIGASRRMPIHGHSGLELTQVLAGSFSDDLGEFAVGDLEETDSEDVHRPIVGSQTPCICLAAVEGRIKPRGFIAPLIQRAIGL